MRRERINRSQKYQYLLLESAFSHDQLSSFSNESGLSNRLNPWEYNDELIDLQEKLKERLWEIVEEELTDRQKEVLKLTAKGLKQQEIAAKLFINQSSIAKSLAGNVDYGVKEGDDTKASNKKQKKNAYGGSIRKLQKLVLEDITCKSIIERMHLIREQRW
jgi:hypothetical protein